MMSSTGGEIPRKPRSPAGNPDDDDERVEVMVKRWIAIILLLLVSSGAACSGETVDALTYAVFPYVPDVEHYQELVERRWAEIEPDITGFEIPDRFVVGYGLDCAQKYRNLPYIGVIEE